MPTPPIIDDDSFIKLVNDLGARGTARRLKLDIRAVQRRRRRLELKKQLRIEPPSELLKHRSLPPLTNFPGRVEYEVKDGVVLVGSDCHYWPGLPSVVHRAFVHFCKEMQPSLVVLNGDVVDMAAVSRHPPIGWEKRPTVQEEIECAQDRLHEICEAAGRVPRVWTLGNHDGRFETRLATVAPEYAKVHGIHLKDHFPGWDNAWSCWINSDVVIKHRYKGGINAPRNNTIYAGKTMVTGHLHNAQVLPFTDYVCTRWGMETGCIASAFGMQFSYLEDNPRNWIEAFGLLTFYKGRLLQPELVLKFDNNHVQFRGEIIKV